MTENAMQQTVCQTLGPSDLRGYLDLVAVLRSPLAGVADGPLLAGTSHSPISQA